jgi:hypothetical protein
MLNRNPKPEIGIKYIGKISPLGETGQKPETLNRKFYAVHASVLL